VVAELLCALPGSLVFGWLVSFFLEAEIGGKNAVCVYFSKED
jgi:hypothetical protein